MNYLVTPILFVVLVLATILNFSSGNWILVAVFSFLTILLLMLSVRIVRPNTVYTVEFLGKYNRILTQWFHLIIPILERTVYQSLARRNASVSVQGVTKDNVTANIDLNVIYYVEDDWDTSENGSIYKSIYSIDNYRVMINSTIEEQLRAMISDFTHKEIFSKREEIWEWVEKRLKEKIASFGYKLNSIQVTNINLEEKVMSAMNKVVETEKLKEAALNEAEANKTIQVKEAEAEKEAKILLWEGMAGQRLKIAEWFKEAIDLIKSADESLNAEKILKFLLDSSRIETLWNIGAKENTKLIYLNEDLEGRGSKLVSWSDIM